MRRVWRSLDGVVDRLVARFSVAVLGDDGAPLPVVTVPTGYGAVDEVLGGGLPRGRVAEIYGGPGSGKSAFAHGLIHACQRRGGVAALIDAERSFDPHRAAAHSVDLTRLVVLRPKSGEQAFQLVDALVRRRVVDLIVIDSVAALVPASELVAPVGEAGVAQQARLLSGALRRLQGELFDGGCMLVCLNQTRTGFDEAGAPFPTTSGGQALAFYAATRVELVRGPGGHEAVVRKAQAGILGARAGWDLPAASEIQRIHATG